MRALFLLLLLVPTALAHLDFARPRLQAAEDDRRVEASMEGTRATVDLLRVRDPPTQFVRHVVDPRAGTVESEYREHLPNADEAFRTRYRLVRLVEYRDTNGNGLQDTVDPTLRSWRFDAGGWGTTGFRDVFVGGNPAKSASWAANYSGGPNLTFEIAAAGERTTDEGARAREQDVLLYLDAAAFPVRNVGALYAMELAVVPPPGAAVDVLDVGNATTGPLPVGVTVRAPGRLAILEWGGEALLDGSDQLVNVTLGAADPRGERPLVLHFPRFDRTLHMVMVSAVEYATEDRRAPGVVPLALVAALAVAAALRRAR